MFVPNFVFSAVATPRSKAKPPALGSAQYQALSDSEEAMLLARAQNVLEKSMVSSAFADYVRTAPATPPHLTRNTRMQASARWAPRRPMATLWRSTAT